MSSDHSSSGYFNFSIFVHCGVFLLLLMAADQAMEQGRGKGDSGPTEIVILSSAAPTNTEGTIALSPKPQGPEAELTAVAIVPPSKADADAIVVAKSQPKTAKKNVATKKLKTQKPKLLAAKKPVKKKVQPVMKESLPEKEPVLAEMDPEVSAEDLNQTMVATAAGETTAAGENAMLAPGAAPSPQAAAELPQENPAPSPEMQAEKASKISNLTNQAPPLPAKLAETPPAPQAPATPVAPSPKPLPQPLTPSPAPAVAAAPAASATTPGASVASAEGSSSGGAEGKAMRSYLDLRQMPGNKPPIYPAPARLSGQQGSAVFKYFVNENGSVKDVKLVRSSGHTLLDQEAADAIARYRFQPGQAGWTVHPVAFYLKGEAERAGGRLRTVQLAPANIPTKSSSRGKVGDQKKATKKSLAGPEDKNIGKQARR